MPTASANVPSIPALNVDEGVDTTMINRMINHCYMSVGGRRAAEKRKLTLSLRQQTLETQRDLPQVF